MIPEHKSFNIVGKIAHFFASNRPLSILILVSVLALGFISFIFTPKQYNPEIVRPAFAITLAYGGATQEQAIDRVVYELVEKVSAVPGVDEILTEVRDGAQIGTTVIFEVGYDKTKAKVDLLSQLEQHSYLARGFITEPQVIEINPETIPVLQFVFSSDSQTLEKVRRQVTELGRTLTSIPEVSDVTVMGGYAPALVVEIDPVRLNDAQLTTDDITHTLQSGEARMVLKGFESNTQTIRVVFDGKISSPQDIGALLIRGTTHIRDVAHVYEGPLPSRSYVLYDTKDVNPTEVIMLSVSKVEGSSAPFVTRAVRSQIDTLLESDTYSGLSYTVVSDDGMTATREIEGLTINLVQSIIIVAIMILLFLSFRASILVLISIPTTLLIVFALGYLFDQTINRITLFALILSLGLLVDAATVVVENIYVHLKKRASHDVVEATRNLVIAGSVNEIGVGLLLSAVTSVIVFLPVKYISGMMGPYMAPLSFFVPAAIIVSFLMAITIVPFMATYLLKADEKETKISKYVEGVTEKIIAYYQTTLRRIFASRTLQKKVLGGVLLLFVASLMLPLFGLVHFQMLPRADRDQFYMYLDAPVDTATEATKEISEKLSTVFTEDTDVVSVQQFIAQAPIVDFNGMFKGAQYRNGEHQATFRVNLIQSDVRERSSTGIVTDIRQAVAAKYPEYAPMIRFIEEPPGPPVRATLVAKISSPDEAVRTDALSKLVPLIAGTPGVVDPYIQQDAPVGAIRYTFDREKASALGITESSVVSVLGLYNGAVSVTEYLGGSNAEFTPLALVLPQAHRETPADIRLLTVRTNKGTLIPIESVLIKTYEARASAVYLERSDEFVYITGEVENRPIIYAVVDILTRIRDGELEGYSVSNWGLFGITLVDSHNIEVKLAWGGEFEMTLENFRDLGMAMGIALVLVYATLVAQSRSFKGPMFIMVTVPLGLIGIMWGFLLLDTVFGIYLTATALIGFIALIGIVVNNAIMLWEYIASARQDGFPLEEALVEAGGARFRPIVLTTLTTLFGSLTIAADPVWSGLAWSIFFGLSLSTVLTLVIYPTLLVYFKSAEDA